MRMILSAQEAPERGHQVYTHWADFQAILKIHLVLKNCNMPKIMSMRSSRESTENIRKVARLFSAEIIKVTYMPNKAKFSAN